MTNSNTQSALSTTKVYPEGQGQVFKSQSTSCSTLPALISNSVSTKSINRKIFNLGIIRNGTMRLQEENPELEYTQLTALNESNSIKRKDRNGENIDKRSKKHRITFRDEITGEQVADVVEVTSYKKYNNTSSNVDTIRCSCWIL